MYIGDVWMNQADLFVQYSFDEYILGINFQCGTGCLELMVCGNWCLTDGPILPLLLSIILAQII